MIYLLVFNAVVAVISLFVALQTRNALKQILEWVISEIDRANEENGD